MNSYTTLIFPVPRVYLLLINYVMQNDLTKQVIVHTAGSLLALLVVSCRLEVKLKRYC